MGVNKNVKGDVADTIISSLIDQNLAALVGGITSKDYILTFD